MSEIGRRIRARRTELEMTVDEMAEKLGKNRATVYRYESGDIKDFPTSVLADIAKVLRTTPADLMGYINNPADTSDQEQKLLEIYRNLNASGKEELLKHAKLLSESKSYTANTELSEDTKIS